MDIGLVLEGDTGLDKVSLIERTPTFKNNPTVFLPFTNVTYIRNLRRISLVSTQDDDFRGTDGRNVRKVSGVNNLISRQETKVLGES